MARLFNCSAPRFSDARPPDRCKSAPPYTQSRPLTSNLNSGRHRPYEGSQPVLDIAIHLDQRGRHRPYEGSQRRTKRSPPVQWPMSRHRPYEGSQLERGGSPASSRASSSPLRGVATRERALCRCHGVVIAPTRGRNWHRWIRAQCRPARRHRPYEGSQPGRLAASSWQSPCRHRPYEGSQPLAVVGVAFATTLLVVIAPTRGRNDADRDLTILGVGSSSPLRGVATLINVCGHAWHPASRHRPYEGSQQSFAAKLLNAGRKRRHRPYEGSQPGLTASGTRPGHVVIAPTRGRNAYRASVTPWSPLSSSSPLRGVATTAGWRRRRLIRARVVIAPTRGRNPSICPVNAVLPCLSSSPLRGVATRTPGGCRYWPARSSSPLRGVATRSSCSTPTCRCHVVIAPTRGRNVSSPGVVTTFRRVVIAPTRGRNGRSSARSASDSSISRHRPYEGSQPGRYIAIHLGTGDVVIAPTRGRNATALVVPRPVPVKSSSPLRGVATSPRACRRQPVHVVIAPTRGRNDGELGCSQRLGHAVVIAPTRGRNTATPGPTPRQAKSSSPLRGVATAVHPDPRLSAVRSSSPLRGVATRS